jgi:hypothetical protein
MDLRQIIEALSDQAERLRRGEAEPVEAAPTPPAASAGSLDGLMRLAGQLADTLVPQEPRPGFVAELKVKLAAERAAAAAARARVKEQRLRWAVGLGGALYLASLGFVAFRAAQAVMGRVAGLAAARSGQAHLPRATIAS